MAWTECRNHRFGGSSYQGRTRKVGSSIPLVVVTIPANRYRRHFGLLIKRSAMDGFMLGARSKNYLWVQYIVDVLAGHLAVIITAHRDRILVSHMGVVAPSLSSHQDDVSTEGRDLNVGICGSRDQDLASGRWWRQVPPHVDLEIRQQAPSRRTLYLDTYSRYQALTQPLQMFSRHNTSGSGRTTGTRCSSRRPYPVESCGPHDNCYIDRRRTTRSMTRQARATGPSPETPSLGSLKGSRA